MSETVPEAPATGSTSAASPSARRNAVCPSARSALLEALQQRQDAGQPVHLWLRDDDAVEPSAALDRLLETTQVHEVPITLALIPAFSGEALAALLQPLSRVDVAVHGWAHLNHAPSSEKKQELGAHRPLAETLAELQGGLTHLQHWHGSQCVPMLVPPWNRIAESLVPSLDSIGFKALSTFAQMTFESIPVINTHVDIIDWKGSRAGRPSDELLAELTSHVLSGRELTGILTHHLVHEAQAWHFLEQLFELTADHPAVQWTAISQWMSVKLPDPGLPGQ